MKRLKLERKLPSQVHLADKLDSSPDLSHLEILIINIDYSTSSLVCSINFIMREYSFHSQLTYHLFFEAQLNPSRKTSSLPPVCSPLMDHLGPVSMAAQYSSEMDLNSV